MTKYEIGDDEYEETEEVNTSYDQNQPIGDEPQALNTELSNSEPIDAETGQDFLDIQYGGQDKKIGSEWGSEYERVKNLLERSERPETTEDLVRWASEWGVDKSLVLEVFEKEFGDRYDDGEIHSFESKKIGGFQTVWQQLGYESLNLDGTGVVRATRGINPNKTVNRIIRFIYVSKSDCPICKQYDGHSWAVDSPNRPIIPRLEGKHGNRPFTHPHCKCKWVNVFSDEEVRSSEVNQADFDRTRKWYGAGFDKLNVIQQKMAMIDMLKQSLGMETNTIESIIAVESEPSPYGIQNMLDGIVEKSLNKDEKKEIEESNELEKDFSLNTLLDLIADKLAKKIGKKLGVESRQRIREASETDSIYNYYCPKCDIKLGDEYDAEEHELLHPDYPVEKLGVEATEGIPPEWYDQYFGSKEVGDFDPKEGYQEVTYCKLCDEILDVPAVEDMNKHLINRHGIEWTSATEGGKGSGRIGHQKWMLAGEAGEECPNCMMITEKENGKCVICGK